MIAVAGTVAGVALLNRDRFGTPSPHYVPPRMVHPSRPEMPTGSVVAASALRDAHRVVAGVAACRRIGSGALPSSMIASGQVEFSCGPGTLQFTLHPGNRVQYVRSGPTAFRVIVTARNGEFVTYDSRTSSYSAATARR
jgi:hypothetical protein